MNKNSNNNTQWLEDYFDLYKKSLFDNKIFESLTTLSNEWQKTSSEGGKVIFMGNGGSAATASHMQADFSFFTRYFTDFRPKVKALTDNLPLISAIGNDKSFDEIFVEQLKGNFRKGDIAG